MFLVTFNTGGKRQLSCDQWTCEALGEKTGAVRNDADNCSQSTANFMWSVKLALNSMMFPDK